MKQKTNLIIVAHPDNETILGEVMLKYKKMGNSRKFAVIKGMKNKF